MQGKGLKINQYVVLLNWVIVWLVEWKNIIKHFNLQINVVKKIKICIMKYMKHQVIVI